MAEPNENIVQVEDIENLAISIIGHLEQIRVTTPDEGKAVWDATEYLRLFQDNQIKALRDVFE